MNIRIPPSFSWLAKKYSSLNQEISEVDKALDALLDKKKDLMQSLAAIVKVIEIHEIPVTADDLTIHKKNRKITRLPHGQLTKKIYKYLSSKNNGEYSTTTEIFAYIVDVYDLTFSTNRDKMEYQQAVRYRLKALYHSGKIERKEKDRNYHRSLWRLNEH